VCIEKKREKEKKCMDIEKQKRGKKIYVCILRKKERGKE